MLLKFRIYQKHSLPVNVTVDIKKPKIYDKSVELLEKTAQNIFKNLWILKHIRKGKIKLKNRLLEIVTDQPRFYLTRTINQAHV